MEPATIALIATTVVNAVVPFLNKGLEKLTDKTAEEAFNKRAEIWNKVKGLFPSNDLTTLNLFEENPEDAKNQGMLEVELKHLLKANPEIADQLNELMKRLEELEKNKPAPKNISKIENKDISNSFIINDVKQS